MAIYGTPLTLGGGGGGKNDTLPPLLDNFKASLKKNLLSDLPSGTKIKFGRYGNSIVPSTPQIAEFDLIWVTAKNKQGTTFLVLSTDTAQKQPFNAMVYDTAEPRNSVTSRKTGGNSRYIQSNIHQWLNGNVGSWQAKHPDDEFPPYSDFEKFSQRWTDEERSVLQNTTWTVAKSSADGGGTESFNALFVLPSKEEVGLEGSNNLDIFTDNNSRIIPNLYWALRTPNADDRIYDVSQNGSSSNWFCKEQYTIRPICCPKANTEVSDEPDSDGCYTIVAPGQMTITLSADKMPVSRANDLAGAVWVYNDHLPNNVNDGTKINLTREEIVLPEEGDTDIPPISYTELERPTSTKTWTAPEDGYYKFVGVAAGGYSGVARRTVGASYNVSGGSGGSGGIVASVFKLKRGESVSLTVAGGNVTISYGSETANATHGGHGGSSSSEPDNKVKVGIFGEAGTATGGNIVNMNGKHGNIGKRLEGNKSTIVLGGETVYEKHISRGGYAQSTRQEGDTSPLDKGTTAYIAVLKGNSPSNKPLNFTTKATKTISMLPSKSKVKLGRYGGKELVWFTCKDKNQKQYLIFSDNQAVQSPFVSMMFDNKEPNNPSIEQKQNGNSRYLYSNIHQWLNSDKPANQWYSPQYTYDAPPDYQNKDGFLKDWTSEEKAVLVNNQWTCRRIASEGGGNDTFNARVVLPSVDDVTEGEPSMGDPDKNLDIFTDNNSRKLPGDRDWFLRDPQNDNTVYVKIVYQYGILYQSLCTDKKVIRPLVAINPDVIVSETTDQDGCYTLQLKPPIPTTVEKQVQWDNTKDFYARQFTYNPKKQYQTMLEGAIATLNDTPLPDGQELSKLPSKSKVKLGKFNGTPLKWLVCRDSVDQSLRLVLDGESVAVIGNKMFDNKDPNNSDSDRKNYGNNRYIWSNIHQWLNTDKAANAWYTKQHGADAPPDYANQKGFLNEWTEKEISVLENASWVVTKHSVDGGGTESFQSRVVLPSTTEMGLESNTGGTRIDIFNSNEDRVVTGKYYWCRTPYPSNAGTVRGVFGDGSLDDYTAYYANGVRPLCKPLSNILVSLEPDNEGCYTIV